MRYIAAALIASLGLGACTEPARRALGPSSDLNAREETPIAADTIIDYATQRTAAPKLLNRAQLHLPKARGPRNGPGVVAMSFVMDTTGFVIHNSVRIEKNSDSEFADAFRQWLREAQFEPVRRGGRPVRAAIRNLTCVFKL